MSAFAIAVKIIEVIAWFYAILIGYGLAFVVLAGIAKAVWGKPLARRAK
jgi:hypothetical protein